MAMKAENVTILETFPLRCFQFDPLLKIQMDRAWVNAQLAVDERRSENIESARQHQTVAERAYEEGMTLLVKNDGVISEQRLQKIQFSLQRSLRLLGID